MRQFSLTPNRAEWGDPGAKSGLVVKWRVISSVDPSGTRLRPTRPYGVSGDVALNRRVTGGQPSAFRQRAHFVRLTDRETCRIPASPDRRACRDRHSSGCGCCHPCRTTWPGSPLPSARSQGARACARVSGLPEKYRIRNGGIPLSLATCVTADKSTCFSGSFPNFWR